VNNNHSGLFCYACGDERIHTARQMATGILNYSVLKGDPQRGSVTFDRQGGSPHYRIYMDTGGREVQADVNIESRDGSEVLYLIEQPFAPPNADALNELPMGLTPLDKVSGTLALDYVREAVGGSFLVNRTDMTLLPKPSQRPQDELKNAVIDLLNQAVQDESGAIYAFGSAYQDTNGQTGIHNIHMNQGNPAGGFRDENGVWQDGALFISLPAQSKWAALFIAFQTQSWETDANGDPIGS
jgi:uncharacterized protein YukJ